MQATEVLTITIGERQFQLDDTETYLLSVCGTELELRCGDGGGEASTLSRIGEFVSTNDGWRFQVIDQDLARWVRIGNVVVRSRRVRVPFGRHVVAWTGPSGAPKEPTPNTTRSTQDPLSMVLAAAPIFVSVASLINDLGSGEASSGWAKSLIVLLCLQVLLVWDSFSRKSFGRYQRWVLLGSIAVLVGMLIVR